jgi:hypothetical protein
MSALRVPAGPMSPRDGAASVRRRRRCGGAWLVLQPLEAAAGAGAVHNFDHEGRDQRGKEGHPRHRWSAAHDVDHQQHPRQGGSGHGGDDTEDREDPGADQAPMPMLTAAKSPTPRPPDVCPAATALDDALTEVTPNRLRTRRPRPSGEQTHAPAVCATQPRQRGNGRTRRPSRSDRMAVLSGVGGFRSRPGCAAPARGG